MQQRIVLSTGHTLPDSALDKDPWFDGEGPDRNGCIGCDGCMVGCRYKREVTRSCS
jgi:hypothetical protein